MKNLFCTVFDASRVSTFNKMISMLMNLVLRYCSDGYILSLID